MRQTFLPFEFDEKSFCQRKLKTEPKRARAIRKKENDLNIKENLKLNA